MVWAGYLAFYNRSSQSASKVLILYQRKDCQFMYEMNCVLSVFDYYCVSVYK